MDECDRADDLAFHRNSIRVSNTGSQ